MVRGLVVRDLTVTYPGSSVPAVHGATLHVSRGEIVALVGPSGCGKSSFLSAVVGTVPIESGTVGFDGEDVTHWPTHRRGFGMVFQDGQLFPHRSVSGNISFGLEVARVAREERTRRVADLLALVGLEGMGDRAPHELSGGERQRVALARSLAPSPRFLALDEPLSALDAPLRARLGADVRSILRARGVTAVVVTHDLAEADTIADRVVGMREGHLDDPRVEPEPCP